MLKVFHQIILLLSILFLLTPATPYASTMNDAEYVVITNFNTKSNNVSIYQLQSIFGLKIKAWDDNTPITVYSTSPLNKDHQNFCKNILGIFSHQLQRAWDRLIYSGRANSPTIVSSFEEMIDAVAKTPGAIGYLPRNKVNDMVRQIEISRGER